MYRVLARVMVQRRVAVTMLRSRRRKWDVRRRERRKAEPVDEARVIVLHLLKSAHEHVNQFSKSAHFIVCRFQLRIAGGPVYEQVSFGVGNVGGVMAEGSNSRRHSSLFPHTLLVTHVTRSARESPTCKSSQVS